MEVALLGGNNGFNSCGLNRYTNRQVQDLDHGHGAEVFLWND